MFTTPESRPLPTTKRRSQRASSAKDETPAAFARRLYEAHGKDEAAAASELFKAAGTRPVLRDYMLLEQAKSMIAHARLATNSRIIEDSAVPGPAARMSAAGKAPAGFGFVNAVRVGIGEGVRAYKETLFDIVYGINGMRIRLGDATMFQLDIICAEKAGRVGSEYRELSWLRLIRAKGKNDNQVVSKIISLADAQLLRREADKLPV